MLEALTAPNANRNYDYERLEFYGDSVISFLVILELFLTKDYDYKEGDLDFYRIQQVSNMNFFYINKKENFFKYMINEPQTIFNDFVPAAFDNLKYQERIKHKSLNEINNKVKELKKIKYFLDRMETKPFLETNREMLNQIRYFLTSNNLVESGENRLQKVSSYADDRIYMQDDTRKLSDEDIIKAYKNKIRTCITKIESQKDNKRSEITMNKTKNSAKRQSHKKQFFFKQLADIVESVTGAATVACGLNLTQNYLKQINVLRFDQMELKKKLRELKTKKNNNTFVKQFVEKRVTERNGELLKI